jgi:RHS repeat-associated protein
VRKIENWGTPIYYVRSSVLKNAAMEVVNGTLSRAYVLQNGKVLAEQSSDGQFYWVHGDHLGSTHKLTSTSGAVVYRAESDPHGQILLETGANSLDSHKYVGYERDQATGLDNAKARMYAGQRGRFTQPDPAGQRSGNRRIPQSLNLYAYAGNDPVNASDPSGLDPVPFEGWAQFASICDSYGGEPFYAYSGITGTYEFYCGARRIVRNVLDKAALIALGEWSSNRERDREAAFDATIDFLKASDRATGDTSRFNFDRANIVYPNQEFCASHAEHTLIVEFSYSEIQKFYRPGREGEEGLSAVSTKGRVRIREFTFDFGKGEGSDFGRGTVTIRFEFIDVLGSNTEGARILISLVAERMNRRYLKDSVKKTGTVNLSCKE